VKLPRYLPLVLAFAIPSALLGGGGWALHAHFQEQSRKDARGLLHELLSGQSFSNLTVEHAQFKNDPRREYLHVRLPAGDVKAFRQRVIDCFFTDTQRHKDPKVDEFNPGVRSYFIDPPSWWVERPDMRIVMLEAIGVQVIVAVPHAGGDVLVYRGIWTP
jgi:hypothetical protein